MTKRKMPTPQLSAREVMQGKQYPGIKGKVVHWAHACQLHKNYKQCRRKDLDEVQVYQDLELLEQRRWMEGKGPRVRFLSKEEMRIHEGLPPKPNPDAEGSAASSKEHHD